MQTFQKQNVLLVGLGESGLACARWVFSQGGSLTVLDTRENPPGLAALKRLSVRFEYFNTIDEITWCFDRVCLSPGLSPKSELIQSVLEKSKAYQTAVESEVTWFVHALNMLASNTGYQPKLIGVTGTNGKTTTVRMAGSIIENAGFSVRCAGNIGPSFLHALLEALAHNQLPQFWVLELSSFQLHWADTLACDVATVLNVSEDHLDWHDSIEEYVTDKARIFSQNSICVLNRDGYDVPLPDVFKAKQQLSFGLSQPEQPGEFGLVHEAGVNWLAYRPSLALTHNSPLAQQESVQKLIPADALQVYGLHNLMNAQAALALCVAAGLPISSLLEGLRAFQAEPHRMNHVRQIEGVDYFNDSKGTNVGATIAALTGFVKPVLLIAGGRGKGQNFQPLVKPVQKHCKAVVLLGNEVESLQNTLSAVVATYNAASMAQAVDLVASLAKAGDCIVLSPACSSHDMFSNYSERGDAFIEAVNEYAMQRGQVC